MKGKKGNINMWVFFRQKLEGHIQILYEYFKEISKVEILQAVNMLKEKPRDRWISK